MSKFPLPIIEPSGDGDYWRVRTSHLCGYDHLCDTQEAAGAAAYWLTRCIEGVLNQQSPVRGHEGACTPESGCDGVCMDAAYPSDRELKQRGPQEIGPDMTEFNERVQQRIQYLGSLIQRGQAKQSPAEGV